MHRYRTVYEEHGLCFSVSKRVVLVEKPPQHPPSPSWLGRCCVGYQQGLYPIKASVGASCRSYILSLQTSCTPQSVYSSFLLTIEAFLFSQHQKVIPSCFIQYTSEMYFSPSTHINIEALEPSTPDAHLGYKVLSERDLMSIQNKHPQVENGKLSPSPKIRSFHMVLLSFVLPIAFAVIMAQHVLVSNSQGTSGCTSTDMSYQRVSPYLFRMFRFFISSGPVRIGLSVGSIIMFAASILVIKLSKNSIPSKLLEFIRFYIHRASSIIPVSHYLVNLVPSFIIFLIIGLRFNWSTAGCFSIGTMMYTVSAYTVTAICNMINTPTNIRMAVSRKSVEIQRSLFNAFMFAVLILCVTMGLALISTVGSYVLYANIEALPAFIAGSAFASFLLRSSSTLSFDAIVTAFNFKPIFRNVIPSTAATVVSSGASIATGIASDIFDSFSITTVCTAFLSAGLPYIANNQYALCVFNHLNIDKECSSHGYPKDASFASVICHTANFFKEYPSLINATAVLQFLSVPFSLLIMTMIVYLFVMLCIPFSEMMIRKRRSRRVRALVQFKRSMLTALVLCAVLLAASSSTVFFLFFGASSGFQKSKSHGFGKPLPRMVLNGVEDQCSLGGNLSSTYMLPIGIVKREENYSPVFPSGTTHGSAKGVSMRLFASHCIGIFAGLFVVLVSYLKAASQQVREENSGPQSFITLDKSFLSQIPIAAVLCLTIVVAFRLFGAYGVGLSAVGFVAVSSASLIGKLMGLFLLDAESAQFSIGQDASVGEFQGVVHGITRVTSTSGEVIDAARVMTVVTAFFALLQKCGIWSSPYYGGG